MKEVTYEQPLNERIRTLMRLEYLFSQVDNHLASTTTWDTRNILTGIVDILQITNRADLKTEIIKELDRLSSNLNPLTNSPDVDQLMLTNVLNDLQQAEQDWHGLQGLIAQSLRDNEFINSIKQRYSVPGGTSEFDLPSFHCWLQLESTDRKAILQLWLKELDQLRNAVALILKLIRESARSKCLIASSGFYQQPLDASAPYQMIRVMLDNNAKYFAEISGGKHRITIRFMEMSTDGRPTQTEQDVEFILQNCVI